MNDEVALDSVLCASPSLYVLATPIGNLNDISLRALAVLRAVDRIAAEDTRLSQRLLDCWSIKKPLIPVHQHNEQQAATQLIQLLGEGEHIALITDAGTPGISDPGARVVQRLRAKNYPVIPIPGACAAITALSVAGFTEKGFIFCGFLPATSSARKKVLQEYLQSSVPVIVYEAPHRIQDCLQDMLQVYGGDREILIARELTKRYEEIVLIPLGKTTAWLADDSYHERGEFVLILAPCKQQENVDIHHESQRVLAILMKELSLKQAVSLAAEITQENKKRLYQYALTIKNSE